MDSEKKDFFISYTGNDVQSAEWIAVTLENAGYTTIIQEWDFKPGENFVINMHDALINTKRFIAVLSSDYFDSYYCRAEFSAAFTKDSGSEKGLLIPVLISDIQVEGLFAPVIYIDLYGIEDEEAKKRLLLGVDNQSRPRIDLRVLEQKKKIPRKPATQQLTQHQKRFFYWKKGTLEHYFCSF
ncbi:toll/interleukin-1 receptor domain-containing protein [uncultured Enterococcus sp.]|uniref:toll/interleukin-1 receptor domain-containing protein n=1 Tax=uncultured Enterococcus sp. TaxID=167972 RepID=UPI002AA8F558|nr:toll/interleukin-1 receptor domain-containing protein [uncultured Enterococcus sp.]